MSDTRLTIEVNGADVTDALLAAGAEVEVEEAIDEADAASVMAGIQPSDSGEWASALDDLATPDAELVVAIRHGTTAYTFFGIVVGATWTIAPDAASQIVCRALDRTVEMDREERVVPWPGTADSAIASTIFARYGFATEVETTPAGPDPDVFTPIQRATDWQFLRSLAAKWGYSTFLEVDGDKVTGHFRRIDPLQTPVATLRLGFGGEADSAEIDVDLDGAGTVRASRVPPLSSGPVEASADGADLPQVSEAIATARVTLLGPGDVDGEIDPFEAARGWARQQSFGVRLTTTTNPIRRGPVVRARRTVDVHGLGSRLSGPYLVERARHRLSRDHHEQQLTLARNGLGAGGGSLLGGLL